MMMLLYDDTYEGAMTAIFEAFSMRKFDAEIRPKVFGLDASFYDKLYIEADPIKSERVQNGYFRLDAALPAHMYTAWLSHADGVENLMLAVSRIGFKHKTDPFRIRQYEAVAKLDGWARKVGWEAQRMRQFVRFVQLGDGLYGADVEPEYDVLALIGNHFHDRFPDCRFVIRDWKRRRAIISEPESWYIADITGELEKLPTNGAYEQMWRTYFKTIAIEQRVNFKLQQQFIPKKHRRFLTEFQDAQ